MDILEKITEERVNRGWTEYQLAQNCGITQSTISTWYRKHMLPSIPSLEKICNGLGITMAEFFSQTSAVELSSDERDVLKRWNALNKGQKDAFLTLMDAFLEIG